jgi:hypothetical protein
MGVTGQTRKSTFVGRPNGGDEARGFVLLTRDEFPQTPDLMRLSGWPNTSAAARSTPLLYRELPMSC